MSPPADSSILQFNLLGAGVGASHRGKQDTAALPALPPTFNSSIIPVQEAGSVRRLIHTQVGDGPRILSNEESLLDSQGVPIRLQRHKKVDSL